MDWGIWFRKLWRGTIAAGVAAVLAQLLASVQGLTKEPGYPAWLVILAPFILHVLGMANNTAKHLLSD